MKRAEWNKKFGEAIKICIAAGFKKPKDRGQCMRKLKGCKELSGSELKKCMVG